MFFVKDSGAYVFKKIETEVSPDENLGDKFGNKIGDGGCYEELYTSLCKKQF
ncbi:MAG: hypothetical protein IJR93_13560 [Treponema sp.]|nr:hypothetical protein [Treponema sp.]